MKLVTFEDVYQKKKKKKKMQILANLKSISLRDDEN